MKKEIKLIEHREILMDDSMIVIPERNEIADMSNSLFLEGTGMDIWKAMNTGKSIDEIASLLCEKYEVTFLKAKKDTMAFVEKLKEKKFVV